ncbi:MAG TPA: FlgD immunoglobulin-like domain containing protein [Gaiellaceae bacterium]|nr:FlgD immunoglobulin-like domain containing protein [Gaiellaceae bacterium]
MQRVLTTVTLLGLLVATAGAFAITEHLKLEKSPIFAVQVSAGPPAPPGHRPRPAVFSPVCNCPTDVARIGIRLRHPSRVTVTIVDSDHHTVATRATNRLLGAHSPQHFTWDGRTDSGALVPDGVYYPTVQLNGRRTFQFRNKITVDTQPPAVNSAKGLKPVLLAAPGRSVAIQYDFSEQAHALVYLDGRQIILGHKSAPQAKIKWTGRLAGRPLPAGTYVLSIGARDLAGNETPAAKRKNVTVEVRYVELTPQRITVGSGRRFRVNVKTALRRYTWRLGHRHGEHRGRVLRLHAPSTPGTYRLVVGQPGMSTTAVVRVHQ